MPAIQKFTGYILMYESIPLQHHTPSNIIDCCCSECIHPAYTELDVAVALAQNATVSMVKIAKRSRI